MKVGDICAARSGDKGDILDLTLVARDDEAYLLIERRLTAETVRTCLNRVAPGEVRRYALPGLRALHFVAPTALPGGVHASLHAGMHWQKAAIWLLLEMELQTAG